MLTRKLWICMILLVPLVAVSDGGFTWEEVKCHVCKATVREMEIEIGKVDPLKKTDVSGFRLDANGDSISKTVQWIKSEMYLTELMEKICDTMDDYVKAVYKKNGKFTLLKMVLDGKMNPLTSDVDFVQDGDLNKSLPHFCRGILEDNEDIFLKAFQADKLDENIDIQICSEQAKYCKDAPVQDEYDFDDFNKEEL